MPRLFTRHASKPLASGGKVARLSSKVFDEVESAAPRSATLVRTLEARNGRAGEQLKGAT